MTTTHPEYGNGGVYAFSYILITSNAVSGQHEILQRTGAVSLSLLFCGLVFLQKHSQADRSRRLHHICKGYSLKQATYQWQLRLALGIAFALTMGNYLAIPRSMWMGFASMSLLLPQTHHILSRGFSRMVGVTIGSVIFVLCLHLFLREWVFLLGPLAGFLSGVNASLWLGEYFELFWGFICSLCIARNLTSWCDSYSKQLFRYPVWVRNGLNFSIVSKKADEISWTK